MTDHHESVRRELLLAVVGLAPGGLLLLGATDPISAWQLGVVGALLTGATLAVADRLDGRLVAIPLSLFTLLAVGFLVVRYPLDPEVIGVGIIGMNVGWALNRFVFGVVRPLPAPRRRRAS